MIANSVDQKGPSYSDFLNLLDNETSIEGLHKILDLNKVLFTSPSREPKDVACLKQIAHKIKNIVERDRNLNYDRKKSLKELSSRINTFTAFSDNYSTLIETLLSFPGYPLEIVKLVIQYSAFVGLSYKIDQLVHCKSSLNAFDSKNILSVKTFSAWGKIFQDAEDCEIIHKSADLTLMHLALASKSFLIKLTLPEGLQPEHIKLLNELISFAKEQDSA